MEVEEFPVRGRTSYGKIGVKVPFVLHILQNRKAKRASCYLKFGDDTPFMERSSDAVKTASLALFLLLGVGLSPLCTYL